MSKLLITGASGFVGNAVCTRAAAEGWDVVRAVRQCAPGATEGLVPMGDIGSGTDWSPALAGVDCIIHLAARVHVLNETAPDALKKFRAVNVAGTRALADQAARAGVRRMVFVSTIKVHGEATNGRSLRESDVAAPEDAYARSKLEAEEALREVGARSGLEWVVVRPPLVIGPGVGGNLRRLLALVRRGIPLPFAGVRNERSLIGLENLADMLVAATTVPSVAGKSLLVADAPSISTPRLIQWMGEGMGHRARLVSIPVAVLRRAGSLLGYGPELQRLLGSLVIDGSDACRRLAYSPRVSLQEAVHTAAAYFAAHQGGG